MQGVLLAICTVLAALWFRALTRVRRNVLERASVARHVTAVVTSLNKQRTKEVATRLVAFQSYFRRRQAVVLCRRLIAMEA